MAKSSSESRGSGGFYVSEGFRTFEFEVWGGDACVHSDYQLISDVKVLT